MTLDKIFKEGEIVRRQRPACSRGYDVKISPRKDGTTVSFYFRGKARELYEGEKVVPLVVNNSTEKRIYFAKEKQINASDAIRNPGYKVGAMSKTNAVFFTVKGKEDVLKDFYGEYSNLHLDADCMLYFIERPTRF